MHADYHINIVTCHKCELRDRSQTTGLRCYDGVPLGDHARRGDCPAGKFTAPDVVQVHLPDGLAWNQDQHGNDGCGCAE